LCERLPVTDSLYFKAIELLKQTPPEEGGLYRERIARALLRTIPEKKLTPARIKEWLVSDVRELQRRALDAAIINPDRGLIREITQAMARAKDRDIQYECIRALSSMLSTNGPGHKSFMEDPDRFVREFQQMALGSKTD
jgi:hypothetical protein